MISIDLRDRRPIYEQIIDKFETLILKDVLKENEPMPSVRSLAVQLAINPNTIQKAYNALENKGFIYTISGKGSFVAKNEQVVLEKINELKNTIRQLFVKAKDYGVEKKDILNELDKIYKKNER